MKKPDALLHIDFWAKSLKYNAQETLRWLFLLPWLAWLATAGEFLRSVDPGGCGVWEYPGSPSHTESRGSSGCTAWDFSKHTQTCERSLEPNYDQESAKPLE